MFDNILIKTPEQIEGIRAACRDAALVLDYIEPFVKAGVTTEYLDDLMLRYTEDVLKDKSACLNYDPDGTNPYPKATCISVNHQICHGIPNEKVLKNGDILNIDVTVIKNGYYGDTSRMYSVGHISVAAKHLINVTFDSMWKGIEIVRPGAISEISAMQFSILSSLRAAASCVNSAGRGRCRLPRGSSGLPLRQARHRCCHEARHDLHDRTDDQRRKERTSHPSERLDRRNQRQKPFRPVGTYDSRH